MVDKHQVQTAAPRMSEDQIREAVAIVREALPKVLAPWEVLSGPERDLAQELADRMSAVNRQRDGLMAALTLKKMMDLRAVLVLVLEISRHVSREQNAFVEMQELVIRDQDVSIDELTEAVRNAVPKHLSEKGRKGANAKHDKPQGSREKWRQIQARWASGKYQSRDQCAEKVGLELGMAFSTARRALRKTPKPA